MDYFTKSDIESSFRRIEELLQCGIFHRNNSNNPLFRSALTELLILVRDLMAKAKKYAEPVTFADDIVITKEVKNVSDAIKFLRDAVCHIDSKNHNINSSLTEVRASFCTIFGKGVLANIGDFELKSEYQDDICFLFGGQRLYLRRHIIRAYLEAKEKLLPLLQQN